MPTVTMQTPRSNPAENKDSTTQIGFVTDAPANTRVLRKYTDPQNISAIQQPGDGSQLEIFCSSDTKTFRQPVKSAVTVETELAKISWQPGRAAIIGGDAESLIPAVIDFAFYEGELQKLEEAILPHQATADADVALAYNIRQSEQSQWDRLYRTMEQLYRLRLRFARLEPHLESADPSLPIDARRVFNRLLKKTRMEARLEAFSDRLEAIEDLYEGAVDRITDHRNYRKGSLLEVGIIGLLLLETILLMVQALHGK
jgi:hypothetical protein